MNRSIAIGGLLFASTLLLGCAARAPEPAVPARVTSAAGRGLRGPRLDIVRLGGELAVRQAASVVNCPHNDGRHGHATATDRAGNLLALRYETAPNGSLTLHAMLADADGEPLWSRTLRDLPTSDGPLASLTTEPSRETVPPHAEPMATR